MPNPLIIVAVFLGYAAGTLAVHWLIEMLRKKLDQRYERKHPDKKEAPHS